MLLDGTYGREALFRAADHELWISRPVERPGSRPLRFETEDLGSHLAEWPVTHVIKCLCFYHPNDPEALRIEQEERLLTLYDAARTAGRELLVEIIAGKHGRLADETVATRAAPALRSRHPAGLVEAGAAGDAHRLAAHRRRDPRPRSVLPRRGAAGPRRQRGRAGPGVPDGGQRSAS